MRVYKHFGGGASRDIFVEVSFNEGMGDNRVILVVEDNNFVRLQIVTFLKAEGYSTLEATDGGKALDILDNSVCCLVVDLRMEPMNGFDFIKHVRQEGFKIPAVLITGDQDSDILARAGQHGISAVLLKPIQKDRLLTTVNRLVERGAR